MNFRQLRYFVAVVDAGTLTGAASALGVAQPALSLHVSNLERDLGVKLLLRTARGVVPTEEGEICCRSARTVLNEIGKMQEIRKGNTSSAGEVSLGLTACWTTGFTAPIVAALFARHPRIRLRLVDGSNQGLADCLGRGLLDTAVLCDVTPRAGLQVRRLFRQRMFLVGQASSHRAGCVNIAKLVGRKLVLPSRPNPTRARVDAAFDLLSETPLVAAEANSVAAMLSLVGAGAGEAILPWVGDPDPTFRWTAIDGPGLSHEAALCVGSVVRPGGLALVAGGIVAAVLLDVVRGPDWAGAEPIVAATESVITET